MRKIFDVFPEGAQDRVERWLRSRREWRISRPPHQAATLLCDICFFAEKSPRLPFPTRENISFLSGIPIATIDSTLGRAKDRGIISLRFDKRDRHYDPCAELLEVYHGWKQ